MTSQTTPPPPRAQAQRRMSLLAYLRNGLFGLLLPLAVALTIQLYTYPVWGQCAFPVPSHDASEAFDATRRLHWPYENATLPTELAPFRLLALGDPQLEGDTSVPTSYLGTFPHAKDVFRHLTFRKKHSSLWQRIRATVHDVVDVVFEDVPNILESARKRIDLLGNDMYLAHIYRTVHWWTRPTHVSVLGDLVGSQWIDDAEFDLRGERFWNRVLKGGERVPDDIAVDAEDEYDVSGYLNQSEEIWTKRVMNVAGNHDVGYAGDLTQERVDRFEKVFGRLNYNLRFELPITDPKARSTMMKAGDEDDEDDEYIPKRRKRSVRLQPELRIVVVNDMNLDTPAKDTSLQDATYSFINRVIGTSSAVQYKGHFTLILTHIPLYKPAGVCVDAPFFDFHSKDDGGGVKEQYLLSADASRGFLEGIYGVNRDTFAPGRGVGRPGLVMNGHDHEGCDTYHFVNHTHGETADDRSWESIPWADAVEAGVPGNKSLPGRREITVRSMMGDFGGNAGLLSMWFDEHKWEWRYEYAECPLGRQHMWWLTHILDLSVVVGGVVYVLLRRLEAWGVDIEGWLRRRFV